MTEVVAEKLYAIDLDRTVYDTNRAFAKMVRIAVENGLADRAAIAQARRSVEVTKGSFDLLGFLGTKGISDHELDDLQTVFGNNTENDDFLYPDAHFLYQALDDTATPHFTYTKGGQQNQTAKLLSVRRPGRSLLDEPYVITDSVYKGRSLAAMRVPEGGYLVDGWYGQSSRIRLLARSICLLEDKPASLDGLPEDCSAALVDRSLTPAQAAAVPLVQGRIPTYASLDLVAAQVYRDAELRPDRV